MRTGSGGSDGAAVGADQRREGPGDVPTAADPHEPAASVDLPGREPLGGWRHLRVPLGAFAASRLVALAAAFLSTFVPPGGALVDDSLTFWDGDWYLRVVDEGYAADLERHPDGSAANNTHAFFPLYPFLVRIVRLVLPVSLEVGALLVAVTFGALATVALWHLAAEVADRAVADRASTLFAFFPGSYVLSTAYSEPVMLTFAIGSLWALARRQWLLAGLAAAAATAARPNAVAVVAACAWAAGAAIVRRREWRALLAPALAPLGILGFFGFLWRRTGDATTWFTVQREGWGEGIDFGRAAWRQVDEFVAQPWANFGIAVTMVGLLGMVALTVVLLRARLPGPLNVYTAVIFALALLTKTLTARPRFILAGAPAFIAVARRVEGHAHTVLVGLFAAGLAVLVVAYSFPTPITGAP